MDFDVLTKELALGAESIPQLVHGVTLTEARNKPNPESWSILEVICHLYDEEREDFRQRLDITLNRPGAVWPLIHPDAWVTDRKYNERDLGKMVEQFTAERRSSLDWLGTLAGSNWDAVYTDPNGSMRAGDLLASWVAHDSLHMRQLVELRRTRIEAITSPYEIEYAGER